MLAATELLASLALGASLHLLLLRHGEWDLVKLPLVATALAAPALLGLSLGLLSAGPHPDRWWPAARYALALAGTAAAGLYASMLAYRVSPFHRLYRFPGPVAARLSNFYVAGRALWTHQEYRVLQELHETYGDVVRIGMYIGL